MAQRKEKVGLGSGLGRIILDPRKVRIVCREGTVRVKRDAEFPPIEIELAAGERLVGFTADAVREPVIDQIMGKPQRKTVDWVWTAFIEQDPPEPKPRRRSTSNGRKPRKSAAKRSRPKKKGS